MYYLILGLLVVSALAAAVIFLRKKAKREQRPTFDLQKEVNGLSQSDASALVQEILQGKDWRITDALQEEVHCGPLGNQFFSRFGSVSRDSIPDVKLQLMPSRKHYRPDYVEIGFEMEEGLVVMNIKDDSVVVLDRGEEIEDGMGFRSIYHYLVFMQKCEDSEPNAT